LCRIAALDYRFAIALTSDAERVIQSRNLLDYHLAQDRFGEYLQHACSVDLSRSDAEVCRTHPQYFIWPSERFFVQYRTREFVDAAYRYGHAQIRHRYQLNVHTEPVPLFPDLLGFRAYRVSGHGRLDAVLRRAWCDTGTAVQENRRKAGASTH
jgi:hypothetical protein